MAAASSSSRFAVTCGLLRQYMREQQQQQQPGSLDMPPLVGAAEDEDAVDGRTMQLFPTQTGTLQPSQERRVYVCFVRRPENKQAMKAPLTIFYEGRVLVLEDFPADKAEELMKLAGSGSSSSTIQSKDATPVVQEKPAAKPPAVLPDLPIARKASLQRFLQKRKQRIITSEPYNKVMTAPPLPEKDIVGSGKPAQDVPAASWLGL
ncbi:hypothetical protein HU200_023671 [Digitaria exilis]|uniref:Protein TIFY n=1 Tax=Digitaria exilis TaxID=1010633 RepID=A0A835CBJ4_9POAL|nr:hypothetical protein HU200_023671 [Digitaria exilis]